MGDSLTLTAVFTPDENGWTMAQLAEWPAVVTCAPTLDEARALLEDAAREMVDSYRAEGPRAPDQRRARRVAHDRPRLKRRDLERHALDHGCEQIREGANHTIWANPTPGPAHPASTPPRDPDRNRPRDLPPA